MRKRCLTTLLWLTLCIAFSGCGKEQKETDNKENKGTLLEAKEINVADGITVKSSKLGVELLSKKFPTSAIRIQGNTIYDRT